MKTNTLLIGPPGSGKTTAIKTLLDCGLRLFVIATEPGIENVLGDTDPSTCHWTYIPPAVPEWDLMIKNARAINTMPMDMLMKQTGSRSEYRQFISVLEACNNFTCDRTGEAFGPIDKFDEDCAVAVDSLSGLSIMSMDLVAGSKPVKTMQDWGVAMDNLERLITKLTCDTKCSLILTAHMDRETDEITNATKLMASTLGRKLAPKIPRFFDEVIRCEHDGDDFSWSTSDTQIDLKSRVLPISEKLKPTFVQLFKGA